MNMCIHQLCYLYDRLHAQAVKNVLKLIICNSTLIIRTPSHCHRFLHLLSRFLGKKNKKGLTRRGFEHTTFKLEGECAYHYTTDPYRYPLKIFKIFKHIFKLR